jgi:hypothetical protein
MTGTCPDLLAALRLRERDLEMDAAALRARLEEVREMIALAVGPQRRRRRTEPTEPPQHVPGAANRLPDDDDLPFQADAPGA